MLMTAFWHPDSVRMAWLRFDHLFQTGEMAAFLRFVSVGEIGCAPAWCFGSLL
jgi:hypothetical protein